MLIFYCDSCGARISQSDIEAGNAERIDETSARCGACLAGQETQEMQAQKQPPAQPARSSRSRATARERGSADARSRQASEAGSGGTRIPRLPLWLLLSIGGGTLMLAGAAALFLTRSDAPVAAASTSTLQPVQADPPQAPQADKTPQPVEIRRMGLQTLTPGDLTPGSAARAAQKPETPLPAPASPAPAASSVAPPAPPLSAATAATTAPVEPLQPPPIPGEVVWIDDELPAGAVGIGSEGASTWRWAKLPEPVFSGRLSHTQSPGAPTAGPAETRQHFFDKCAQPLKAGPGDTLFAYVHLNPNNPPKEIMLQFHFDGSWEHRACWGEDLIPFGAHPPSRVRMGALPAAGQWVRLEIPAAKMGVTAEVAIAGLAFTQYAGEVFWDKAGAIRGVQAPPAGGPGDATAADAANGWNVLEPLTFTSSSGTVLVKGADNSLLAQGTIPPKDVFTVTAKCGLKAITGFRLELLTDPSLPGSGPGHSPNGNIVLSTFKVDKAGESVALRNPSADFCQAGFGIAGVLDVNVETGWAMMPEVGKAHEMVVETAVPLALAPTDTLSFTLEHLSQHGHHLTGRFRLSVTAALPPLRAAVAGAPPAAGVTKLLWKDFQGGGDFNSFAGGNVKPSKAIWGKRTPKSQLNGAFELGAGTFGPAALVVTCLRHGSPPCQISYTLNGGVIFSGPDPSPGKPMEWIEHRFPIGAGVLKSGRNELQINNLEDTDKMGQDPWYMIHTVEIQALATLSPEEVIAAAAPKRNIDDDNMAFGPEIALRVQRHLAKGNPAPNKLLCAGAGYPVKNLDLKGLDKWVVRQPPKELCGPACSPAVLLAWLPEVLESEKPEVVLLFGDVAPTRKVSHTERLDWEDVARVCLRMGAVPVFAIPPAPAAAGANAATNDDADLVRSALLRVSTESLVPAINLKNPPAVPERLKNFLKLLEKHVLGRTVKEPEKRSIVNE